MAHVLIIQANFYKDITQNLLDGACQALKEAGATYDILTVPGALEIPTAFALQLAHKPKGTYQAGVALGCVIRGETYHFEIVSNESARGLMNLSLAQLFPIGNGILTVENQTQADYRADPLRGNKGGEAAKAAMVLAGMG